MKRFVCILLSVCLVCSLFAGCTQDNDTVPSEEVVETLDSVVAEVNGVSITRSEVGSELLESEQSVIVTYIYDMMLQEFFSEIEVSDEELELQLQLLKNQVGEDSWDLYLAYYGGGSEEEFRVMLKNSLKQEKYISSVSDGLTVSDEELQAAYEADPNYYNIAVLDVVFLDTEENYTTAIDMFRNGSSLEEISGMTGIEISEDEHTFYSSDSLTWSADWADVSIGDVLYTTTDSGAWLIGRVTEMHEGLEDDQVLENLKDELLYELAYAQTEAEYAEFLKSQVVTIMGTEYTLYQEDTSESE